MNGDEHTLSANSSTQTCEPLVSVVVTCKNEERKIENCVRSLANQSYSNFEIILIDAKSTDGTLEKASNLTSFAKSHKNCKRYLVISAQATPAQARNAGVRTAHGEIIAFTDADCVAEENWIDNLMKHVANGKMVGGPNILQHPARSMITDAIDSVLSSYLGSGGSSQFLSIKKVSEVSHLATCNMAISKKLFEEIGGFNEDLRYVEDVEFAIRLREKGYEIIYVPEAKVHHLMGIDSFIDFRKFIYNYGLQRGINAKKNIKTLAKFNAFSLVFILMAVSLGISSFFSSAAFLALVLIFTAVFAVFLAESIRIAMRNRSPLLMFVVFPIFISERIIYNFNFLKGLMLGKK